MRLICSAALLSLALGIGPALAQTPAQPPANAPAMRAVPSGPGATDKKAISKACTDQANAKGLHGKERKKFRSACKKNGGNTS